VNSETGGSQAFTFHVIPLHSDLLSLVFRHLTPATLFLFPKEHFTKEDFRVCLENWLGHLKEWNNGELANVECANKIAQDLGLTGGNQKTSLALNDPLDNTQPAPWAEGLAIVLTKACWQLKGEQEPTLLMPWIFIPDGQAFHFTNVSWKLTMKTGTSISINFYRDFPSYSTVFQLLVPERYFSLLEEGKDVHLDSIYVLHNRDENPVRKSQVNDLMVYNSYKYTLKWIWYKLREYPWLRNYVKFGKTALAQLLAGYEQMVANNHGGEKGLKQINDVKVLLQGQLENNDK